MGIVWGTWNRGFLHLETLEASSLILLRREGERLENFRSPWVPILIALGVLIFLYEMSSKWGTWLLVFILFTLVLTRWNVLKSMLVAK